MSIDGSILRRGIPAILVIGLSTMATLARGGVLPAKARPHGYTLADMAQQAALFTKSGNDLAYYPDTPFQILYFASPPTVTPNGDGHIVTGSNTIPVAPGTMLYVPIASLDDSPPFVTPFPTTPQQAVPYFFSQTGNGGSGFSITVDGETTNLGSAYLAGPVETPPLPPDSPGTHILTIGAFLTPLTPGRHTVIVKGRFGSPPYLATYGIAFEDATFTYVVNVGK